MMRSWGFSSAVYTARLAGEPWCKAQYHSRPHQHNCLTCCARLLITRGYLLRDATHVVGFPRAMPQNAGPFNVVISP